MRRVAVTGLGVICPVGVGCEETWASLSSGRSGVGPIDTFDVSEYRTRFAGLVDNLDLTGIMDPKEERRTTRFQKFALVAAAEAMRDAGLTELDGVDAERVGVIVGSGIGGLNILEEQTLVMAERGPNRVTPLLIPMMIIDEAAGLISIRYGAKGPNWGAVSACSSGAHAFGESFETIRRGAAEVVVSGGFDAGVTPLGMAGFSSARTLSTRNDDPQGASRPFDAGRDGFVMGEGGGILVLEEWEHALARGARIRAEMIGYGATADAYHITAPAPDGGGAARAMRIAMEEAGVAPSEIGYINAHGTSTELGDVAETLAVKKAFGSDIPPMSSTKSMTGHLLGGAGGLEAVASLLAMENSLLPPTINYTDPDPECDLDYVPNVARPAAVDVVMSNSFGFGGHNASLIFRKP